MIYRLRKWWELRRAEWPLPAATPAESAEAAELRRAFTVLPEVPTTGVSEHEADWNSAMNRLRQLGMHADPRAFQRWDVIVARMAHVNSPASAIELSALRSDPDWETRWRAAIEEVETGFPIPFDQYPHSSEVLIQTAYHTRELERLSGRRVSEWDVIVEFGGGFGGLCRLMYTRLGFRGRYLIFDLPPFSLLQGYYLEANGLTESSGVTLTSDWGVLEQFVNGIAPGDQAVFWATWSLSETATDLRARVAPLVARIGHYCIAFQGEYNGVDNTRYFNSNWVAGPRTIERIAHRPDDFYMAGTSAR